MESEDNSSRIRARDKFLFRVRDNWHILTAVALIAVVAANDHFALAENTKDVKELQETIKVQLKEINTTNKDQAKLNGRVQATQEAILQAIQAINTRLGQQVRR